MKVVGKIYSGVDADELEAGDIVEVSDIVNIIKEDKGFIGTLSLINDDKHRYRFAVSEDNADDYLLAKLICPKKHVEVYKAWKNGAKIELLNYFNGKDEWHETSEPTWEEIWDYRVAVKEDPYAELKKAYAEGKTIQIRSCTTGEWNKWLGPGEPNWDAKVEDYRIRPESEDLFVESKKRRMTNRELAKWLAQGKGQLEVDDCIQTWWRYDLLEDDLSLDSGKFFRIRAWDEEEWHEPMIEEAVV